jgi:hypothetical protein
MKNLVLLVGLFLLTNISFAQQTDYSEYKSVEKVYWKAGNNNYIRFVNNVLIADVTNKAQATVFLTLKVRFNDAEFTLIQEPKTKLFVCAESIDDYNKPVKLVEDGCDSKYNDNIIEAAETLCCLYCDDNDQVIKVRNCRSDSGDGGYKGSMKFTFELIEKIKSYLDYSDYESVEKVYWKAGNNNYIRIVNNVVIADVTDKNQATVFLTLKKPDLHGSGDFTLIYEPISESFVCTKGYESEVEPVKLFKDGCDSKYNIYDDKEINAGFKGRLFCDDNDKVIKVQYAGSSIGGPKVSREFTFEVIEKIK